MDKKFLLILVFGMFLVISCYGVLGATNFEAIAQWGNYTTNVNLSLTTALANALNVTCYYNASGGDAIGATELVSGATYNLTTLNETLISITSLADSLFLYSSNITCNVSATAGATSEIASIQNITFDSTAPNMTFYNVVSGGYYGDSVNFNASILDALVGVQTVYFNITNSSGGNITSLLNTQQAGNYYSNNSFDTSAYTDGVYNLTVYANDSLGNLNTTAISFTIDNTNPSPSALTSSSATTTSLTITFSGADGTCIDADRSGATISGFTLTETGLNCGSLYTYTITCTDAAGNAGSSSATSFSTISCGAPATTSRTSQYTNTYVVSGEQFQQGYTKEIAVRHRAKVKVGASYHYIGVKALTATTATIEIASDPVEVTLDVGEEVKIDVTKDGYYDIYVKLIDLVNNKANLLIKEVYEEIPEGEGDIATSGEIIGEDEEDGIVQAFEKNLIWLWALIGFLLIVGVVIWLKAKGKSKPKK